MDTKGMGTCAMLFAAMMSACRHADSAADTTASAGAIADSGAMSSAPTTSGMSSSSTDSAGSTAGQSLSTASAPGVDRYLTDANGRTVYMFVRDGKNVSTCTDACVAAWPPLAPGSAASMDSTVRPQMVGTISRSDNRQQTTYNGMPVYYYGDDERPGDIKGQGKDEFGGRWYLVSPTGRAIKMSAKSGARSKM